MTILDTNIFLRYMTSDEAVKSEACYQLFRQLQEGTEQAVTTETVLAEIIYVLTSKRWYQMSHEGAGQRLLPLLTLRGLKVENKQTYVRAVHIFITYPHLDFEDAIIVAFAEREGIRTVTSYDRGFDQVPGVSRVEPACSKAA